MAGPSVPSGKHYYSHSDWDENTWIDVIAIEYHSLIRAYPFDTLLHSLSSNAEIRLLDIGCGSGIFPRFLDPTLSAETSLQSDLLDISAESLRAAERTFAGLQHFEVDELFNMSIEDIPAQIPVEGKRYDIIWAIHSLTTVDQAQMRDVFLHIRDLLTERGIFFIYQLTAQSTYQALHLIHAQSLGLGAPPKPYMQFEDSLKLLDEISWPSEVHELAFPHRIAREDTATLEAYLHKVLLDDGINARELFGSHLDTFLQGDEYVFPQTVNLIVLKK